MKKSLIALAVLSAAGFAHAQSNVTIYGQMDVQIAKRTGATTSMGAGDNNKLGFKGEEDLGGGLKAIFQAEMRFDPDTGTTEAAPNRPLFQGQTRVGLKGDFGMVRVGRGLTVVQEAIGGFEPWSFVRSRAALTSYTLANYNGDPLYAGSSQNRWSNGLWYNSPNMSGFQFGGTIGTKEAQGTGTPTANPYSLSGTYSQSGISLGAGYERNAVETKFWYLGGSFMATPELKLMASYSRQDQGATKPVNPNTKGWVLGGQYAVGTGTVLLGYGQIKPDGSNANKRFSIGYEHNLSKRTYLYVDAYNEKPPVGSTVNSFDVGINHRF